MHQITIKTIDLAGYLTLFGVKIAKRKVEGHPSIFVRFRVRLKGKWKSAGEVFSLHPHSLCLCCFECFLYSVSTAEDYLNSAVVIYLDALYHLSDDGVIVHVRVCLSLVDEGLDACDS